MNPHSNSGRKKNKGWEEGEDANWTTPQTTAQTLNEELADPSSVQIYFVPCEPALMGLTVGCPLSSWAARPLSLWTTFKTCGPLNLWATKLVDHWTAKLLNRLTAKLVNHLTTKLMNHLIAKLVDHLTTKLVVVNLVKLHLTKFNILIKIILHNILISFSHPSRGKVHTPVIRSRSPAKQTLF